MNTNLLLLSNALQLCWQLRRFAREVGIRDSRREVRDPIAFTVLEMLPATLLLFSLFGHYSFCKPYST